MKIISSIIKNFSLISTIQFILLFFTYKANSQIVIFYDSFDGGAQAGWTTGATGVNGGANNHNSWVVGVPKGGKGINITTNPVKKVGNPDPVTDYTTTNTINMVYGQGIQLDGTEEGVSSYYSNSNEWILTPAINCSNYMGVRLSFWRWANIQRTYDSSFVEISTDKIKWTKLAQNSSYTDLVWKQVSIDISIYANRKATVYIRWRTRSNATIANSGYNLDDVSVTGTDMTNVVWDGSSSTIWSTKANWNTNLVPDSGSNIVIPAGLTRFPNITSTISCRSVTIIPTATIKISSTGILNVRKDFLLSSSASSFGTLINLGKLNVLGKSKMERFLTANQWTLISSPVTGYNRSYLDLSCYYYNEPLSSTNIKKAWSSILISNTAYTLIPSMGYDVKSGNDNIISFTGTFNKGSYTSNLTYTNGPETANNEGWNLVGNPYPAYLNWNSTSINKNNINDAIYLWNSSTKTYSSYVDGIGINGGTQYIPPTAAFFVKGCIPGNASIIFSDAALVASATSTILKSTSPIENRINILVKSAAGSDESVIRFTDNVTTGFDANKDAIKFFGSNTEIAQIYTKASGGEDLGINSLPNINGNIDIPIYLSIQQAGNFKLKLDGIESISADYTVLLEDVRTGNSIDLRNTNVIDFNISNITNSSLFIIHITGNAGNITTKISTLSNSQTINNSPINIYTSKASLFITGANSKEFKVINTNGQIVFSGKSDEGRQGVELVAGAYIIQIDGITKKIILY